MFSSANEYGRASTLDSRAAVDRARALLETALTTSGEDIRAVARHFERLAHEVQNVLDLTSGIVNCVQQDWVVSIVPSARALASSARRFIEERIDSLAAISTVFTSEAKMLETLLSLTTEQRFIAREGETLAVLASIEVAQSKQLSLQCMMKAPLSHSPPDVSHTPWPLWKMRATRSRMQTKSPRVVRRCSRGTIGCR